MDTGHVRPCCYSRPLTRTASPDRGSSASTTRLLDRSWECDPRLRRLNAAAVLATSLVMLASTFSGAAATTAPEPTGEIHLPRQLVNTVKPPPDHYTPSVGVKYNNPLGDKEARRRIVRHLLRTINSVPPHEKIRIATWNFRSDAIADALIRAHNRGVSVRVVIDRLNANEDNKNDVFTRLTRALKRYQLTRRPEMKSYTRRCVSACRAAGGIAHNKFFLFSRAGLATDVVMYGSFNATDLATGYQWNDLYTLRGHGTIYDEFNSIFDEMAKDKNVAQPYERHDHGRFTSSFFPYKGKGTDGDPILDELGKVVCDGATGGTGTNGHTKVRIAQTSMHGARGTDIAGRLRQMWQRGCDIKIVYAVFGNEVLSILRHTTRGPVPIKQIAQDFTRDGVYDRYLHMKTMAISGVYNGDTSANVTWNGSSNWTSVALASDEVVMRIFDARVRKVYSNWFDYLFTHPPKFSNLPPPTDPDLGAGTVTEMGRRVAVNPYSQMQLD